MLFACFNPIVKIPLFLEINSPFQIPYRRGYTQLTIYFVFRLYLLIINTIHCCINHNTSVWFSFIEHSDINSWNNSIIFFHQSILGLQSYFFLLQNKLPTYTYEMNENWNLINVLDSILIIELCTHVCMILIFKKIP